MLRPLERCLVAWLCFFVLSLACACSLMSQTFPPRPEQHECIFDEALLIHPEDAEQIRTLCNGSLRDQNIPIVVVTIPSLAKYDASDVESYARALFDNWGIGSQNRNYGILVLVSLADRKARIELGSAWAGAKDDTTRMVMNDIMVPNFKKGEYSAGILAGVTALDTMARGQTVRRPIAWGPLLLVLGVILAGVVVGISLIRSGKQGWGWAVLAAVFAFIAGLLWLASRTRSSDGDNYSGGSGGGGGSTGSW